MNKNSDHVGCCLWRFWISALMVLLSGEYVLAIGGENWIAPPGKDSVTIINQNHRDINFRLRADGGEVNTSGEVCRLPVEGCFLELSQPYGRDQMFWLTPGHTYKITGETRGKWMQLRGDDPVADHEVRFFYWLDSCCYDDRILVGDVFSWKDYRTLSKDSLAIVGQQKFETCNRLLDQYVRTRPVSSRFERYCRDRFRLQRNMMYQHLFFHYFRTQNEARSQEYKVLLDADASLFRNDSLFSPPLYSQALSGYNDFLARVKHGKLKPSLPECYNVARESFSGKNRNYLLTVLYKAMLRTDDPARDSVDFMTDCTDPAQKLDVQKMNEFEALVEQNGTDRFLRADGKVVSWDEMRQEWRGKVVYIDCWASWCAPCRALMPASHALAGRYAGRDVVFVYLSIDTDVLGWQKACQEEKLSGAQSYCVLRPKEFRKNWKVETIPHYLLLDRQGKVVKANAPRPGDAEVGKLLESLLN